MDTVSGTVYHKSKKFPIYAGAESPANYTTASESTQSHVTSFWRWLLIARIIFLPRNPYDSSSPPPYHLHVSIPPLEHSAGLPDGPPATTATITAAPNPTQQWAITLDGTVVGGEVSPRSSCFLLLALGTGWLTVFLCVEFALGGLVGWHV
jgi:hypothetical protein